MKAPDESTIKVRDVSQQRLEQDFFKKSQDLYTIYPGLGESFVRFREVLREMLESKVLGPQGGEQGGEGGGEGGGDVGHESSKVDNFFVCEDIALGQVVRTCTGHNTVPRIVY